jgi:membrane-associated HD superfamily phosphohydrolase
MCDADFPLRPRVERRDDMFRVLTLVAAGLAAIAAVSVPGHGFAQAYAPRAMAPAALTKDGYLEAKKNADAQYKSDREACSSLAGNAKDICIAEAKGKNDVSRAEAAVAYENTPVTRENARVARARAAHDVAIEKCDDLAGNPKDVCIKEARAALVRAKADAKVDRIAGNARQGATAKAHDAAREADAEKREADYKVAIEKCDAFAGPAKEACVGNAKLQYGKT